MKYAVDLEQGTDGGWGAYAPKLPGLGVVGQSRREALRLLADGVAMRVRGLREDGAVLPSSDVDAPIMIELDGLAVTVLDDEVPGRSVERFPHDAEPRTRLWPERPLQGVAGGL